MIFNFFIEGMPKGQARPRVVSKNGRTWAFSPKNEFRDSVLSHIKSNIPAELRGKMPITSGLSVSIVFHMPRPKSVAKSEIWHIKRPDIDNLIKAVLDAVNDTKIWEDDSQIYEIKSKKVYSDDKIGAEVSIECLKEN